MNGQRVKHLLTIILLIAFSMPAFAEAGPDSYTISPFVGGYLLDGNRAPEHRPAYGLQPGYAFISQRTKDLNDYTRVRIKEVAK
jgi:hypothetical protein